MKVARNAKCPCGSGKKYKRCCLEKDERQFAEALIYSTQNTRNEARIKQCLHPNQEECKGKIVKAHAIQNNRILNKLAKEGLLVTLDGTSHYLFQSSDIKGRKIATTFTGFCEYHDKTLFQEIEDKDFMATTKQVFLLTYRTMAWHYHKKQEQVNAVCIQTQKMFSKGYDITKSEDFADYFHQLNLGLNDNDTEKTYFDKAVVEENYNFISSYIWEIPYEVNFAVSMMTELEYDINGNKINDLINDKNIKNIYLNIFPLENKSYCIWSWLNIYDEFYLPFAKQFDDLSINDRENYLNNYLPRWTDSIVVSPRLWEFWGKQIQEALITHANFDVLYRTFEREERNNKYTYMGTPWNLFSNLENTD